MSLGIILMHLECCWGIRLGENNGGGVLPCPAAWKQPSCWGEGGKLWVGISTWWNKGVTRKEELGKGTSCGGNGKTVPILPPLLRREREKEWIPKWSLPIWRSQPGWNFPCMARISFYHIFHFTDAMHMGGDRGQSPAPSVIAWQAVGRPRKSNRKHAPEQKVGGR